MKEDMKVFYEANEAINTKEVETMNDLNNEVLNEVKSMLDETYEVTLHKVKKNNNVEMTAISIRKAGENLTPTIYLKPDYYETYSIRQIAVGIIEMYKKHKKPDVDLNDLYEIINDKEKLLSRVKMKLVGPDQDPDLITGDFLDLKIVFYIEVKNDTNSTMTINLNKNMTDFSSHELSNAAIKRIGASKIRTLYETLTELGLPAGMYPEDEIPNVIVLTNKNGLFGATQILDTENLDYISEWLLDKAEELIIIPSSIHEVLVVPSDQIENNPMLDIVRDINSTVVDSKEVLSNNIYLYNVRTKTYSIISE